MKRRDIALTPSAATDAVGSRSERRRTSDERRRAVPDPVGLGEVLVQMADELGGVGAGRAHVDEAEQCGAESRVADHRLHHAALEPRAPV